MSAARRITITQETVRLALAEMHAHYQQMPTKDRLARIAESDAASPGKYAAAVSGWLFSKLEKHAEPQS
jgi:hypothetical protein